ncbi:MAG: hypothetical protein E4H32_07950, partial [Nitrospirales bacterium]
MNRLNLWAFSMALFIGIAGSQTWAFPNSSTSITITNPVYFETSDGSDMVVQPGTYTIEAAEEWL